MMKIPKTHCQVANTVSVRPVAAAAVLRGMRLPADGKIVSLITFAPEAEQSDLQILTATANGYGKRTPIADYSRKNKGG